MTCVDIYGVKCEHKNSEGDGKQVKLLHTEKWRKKEIRKINSTCFVSLFHHLKLFLNIDVGFCSKQTHRK